MNGRVMSSAAGLIFKPPIFSLTQWNHHEKEKSLKVNVVPFGEPRAASEFTRRAMNKEVYDNTY